MKVKLTMVETRGGGIRTNDVVGECVSLPSIGEGFQVLSESLDPDKQIREIYTTPVQTLKRLDENSVQFTTKNTTYNVTVLKEVEGD